MLHRFRVAGSLLALTLAVTCTIPAHAAKPGTDRFGGFESPSSPAGLPKLGTGPEFHTGYFAKTHAGFHPGLNPRGVNDFSCKPQPGENPIVLIPGTTADAFGSWALYGPQLASRGFCVFSFNYNPAQHPVNEAKGFTGDIMASAAFLGTIVDRVLASTKADKVDLIGHSQGGGPLPRAYLKFFGGTSKVGQLIGLTPSNFGTTMGGLATLFDNPDAMDLFTEIAEYHNLEALKQQLVGSDFMTKLNNGPILLPGIKYTVITTTTDTVVTPYTNALLPGATNIVIQDHCPLDLSGHSNFTYDTVAFQFVLKTLRPHNIFSLNCSWIPDYLVPTDRSLSPAES